MSSADLRAALVELNRRRDVRKAVLAELGKKQRAVALSNARYKLLLCGRRSGKTELAARLILISLLDSEPNEWTVFGAKTRGTAERIVWITLKKLLKRHGLDQRWKVNEGNNTVETDYGASFMLVGFKDPGEIEKLRGLNYRLFIADEASTYEDLISSLIVDIVQPALGEAQDADGNPCGTVMVMGTPGYAKAGWWFEASTGTDGSRLGWRRWKWTIRQNERYRGGLEAAEAYLQEVLRTNGWTEDEPQFRREYLAEWVADGSMLVYPHHQLRGLPADWDPSDVVASTLGIDYGFNDATAWVVVQQRRGDPRGYVVHAEKSPKLLPDELALRTKDVVERFRVTRAVADPAAGGKAFYEEFNARYGDETGVYVDSANKVDRKASIDLLNADLRRGRLVLCSPVVHEEMSQLPYADERRLAEHPAYDNHACDALRYAHRALEVPLGDPSDEDERRPSLRDLMERDLDRYWRERCERLAEEAELERMRWADVEW